MSSSLLPERLLMLSPSLASTIGLEEAVMLQALADSISHRPRQRRDNRPDLHWVAFTEDDLEDLFPFWQQVDLRRIQVNLQSLGLIAVDPDPGDRQRFFLAIDEARQEQPSEQERERQSGQQRPQQSSAVDQSATGAASLIPPNWQPDDNWIRLCKQQAIPEPFIRGLVPEFISYWRERGQARFSWGNAFYKHVLKEWRNEQTRQGAYELASNMSADWCPSPDAIEILMNAGVTADFIEDAVPEFVLYWRERGMVHGAWNTKFIEHIRRQWAKFSASFGRDNTPQPIPEDWQPSNECYEILQLAEIDEEYARSRVPEFVMYWRDSGQARASWNTIFLQFIKQDWARQLRQQESADYPYAENQTIVGSGRQRTKEKFRRIIDRSWAE